MWGEPPHLPCDHMCPEQTSFELAAKTLEKHTGLVVRRGNEGWVDLKLVGLDDTVGMETCLGERSATVIYGCLIPEETLLLEDAHWLNLSETWNLLSEKEQQYITAASQGV